MRTIFLLVIMTLLPAQLVAQDKAQYYLKWDRDHTERALLPGFPIAVNQLQNHKAYRIVRDAENRPTAIQFYFYGTASNASDFGAYEMRITYQADTVLRQYFDLDGAQVQKNTGVFTERYILEDTGFYSTQENLNAAGEKIADQYGVAETRIIARDDKGRRTIERHYRLSGEVMRDRFNGFWETRFLYDNHDHVKARRAYNLTGEPALGKDGFHTAYFWFDDKANLRREEFRDLQDKLVIPTDIYFATIEFDTIDQFGKIQEVRYFGVDGQPLQAYPAISMLTYDEYSRIIKRTYHASDMTLMNNNRGVAIYHYTYNPDKSLKERLAFDVLGQRVQ